MKRRGNRAFTLIEVLISVLLLSLCVVSITGFLAWLARSTAHAECVARAKMLGQQQIERLLSEKYSDIASGNGTVSPYNMQWAVSESNGIKTIRVTVDWSGTGVPGQPVQVQCMVSP